jgi:hypothetical protein
MHSNMNVKKSLYQLDFISVLCSTLTVKAVSELTPIIFRLNVLGKLAQLAFFNVAARYGSRVTCCEL